MSKVSEHLAKFHSQSPRFWRLGQMCDDAMGKMGKAVAGDQVHAVSQSREEHARGEGKRARRLLRRMPEGNRGQL